MFGVVAHHHTVSWCVDFLQLAMLGMVLALVAEFRTNKNVFEQVAEQPFTVAGIFTLWIVASLVPILRGAPRRSNGKVKGLGNLLSVLSLQLVLFKCQDSLLCYSNVRTTLSGVLFKC